MQYRGGDEPLHRGGSRLAPADGPFDRLVGRGRSKGNATLSTSQANLSRSHSRFKTRLPSPIARPLSLPLQTVRKACQDRPYLFVARSGTAQGGRGWSRRARV